MDICAKFHFISPKPTISTTYVHGTRKQLGGITTLRRIPPLETMKTWHFIHPIGVEIQCWTDRLIDQQTSASPEPCREYWLEVESLALNH